MALQYGRLRDALVDAGADPEKASAAAEEVATSESRFSTMQKDFADLRGEVRLLRWMVAVSITLEIAILAGVFFRH